MKRIRFAVCVTAMATLGLVWVGQMNWRVAARTMVQAATITVNDTGGGTGGPGCKLRDAIKAANSNTAVGGCAAGTGVTGGAPDVIVLPANATITLTERDNSEYGFNGLPAVTGNVVIEGNGSIIERSSAAFTPAFRLFAVVSGELTVRRTWLRNGLAVGGAGQNGGGGGAGMGGAIFSQSSLRLESSTITNCEARGGTGNATLTQSYMLGGGGGGGGMGGNGASGNSGIHGGGGGGYGGNGVLGGSTVNGTGGGGGGSSFDAFGGSGGFANGGDGEHPNAPDTPRAGGVGGGGGGGRAAQPTDAPVTGGKGANGGHGGGGGGGATVSFILTNVFPPRTGGNGGNGGNGGLGGGGAAGGGGGKGSLGIRHDLHPDGPFNEGTNGGAGGAGGTGGTGGLGGGGGAGGVGGAGNDGGLGNSFIDVFGIKTWNPGGDGGAGGAGGTGGAGGFGGGAGTNGSPGTPGTGNWEEIPGTGGAGGMGGVSGGGAGMGGAIFNHSGSLYLSLSTISGNRAVGGLGGNNLPNTNGQGLGGAIFLYQSGCLIDSATLTDNSATQGGSLYGFADGALSSFAVTAQVNNSILANSPVGVFDTFLKTINGGAFNLTGSFNLVEANGPGSNGIAGVIVTADPKLGPLQINGPGNIPTHALASDSLALDQGQNQTNFFDQRGWIRANEIPHIPNAAGGNGADIGAYEKAWITIDAALNGTAGQGYIQQLKARPLDKVYSFGLASGSSLPPGLSLQSNGLLSGTPTQIGTHTFNVVASSQGESGATALTIAISCPSSLSVSFPADGQAGIAYNKSFQSFPAGGGYSYAVTAGTLPPGLTLASNGVLSGLPTLPGDYFFSVQATGFGGCSGVQAGRVSVFCSSIITTPSNLSAGSAGVPYGPVMFSSSPATGTYSYTALDTNNQPSATALPPGMSLTSAGVLSGTPTAGGVFQFGVRASNFAMCSNVRFYTWVVECPNYPMTPLGNSLSATATEPVSVTFNLPDARPGANATYSATGMPPGLTLSSAGVLSGTPTTPGSYSLSIRAQNHTNCTVFKTYNLTVNCPTLTPNSNLTNGTVGGAYSHTLSTSPTGGNYAYKFFAGSLPPGLSLAGATGVISGIPSQAGAFSFVLEVKGFGTCTVQKVYTITIGCPTVTLAASLPNGTASAAYSQSLATLPAGLSAAVESGMLPSGLSLSAAALLNGVATQIGAFNFTVAITGAGCAAVRQSYTLTINCPALTLSGNQFSATAGESFSHTLAALPHGGNPSFALANGSSLPSGVTLATNGTLSGTITTPGAYSFNVKVTGFGMCEVTLPVTLQVACNRSLGNYPNASVTQGGTITVNPNAAPGLSQVWLTASANGFAGTFAVNPATGAVRISNAQTPGTYLVTVRGLGVCPRSFTLTVNAVASCPDAAPTAMAAVTTGNNPVAAVSADFNLDGKADVVTANSLAAGLVSVLLGNGDGTLQTKRDFAVGPSPSDLVAADFNGDGKLDLAVTLSASAQVGLLRGNGDGSFLPVQLFDTGASPSAVVAGDFNGDGIYDLATANATDKTVSVLRGNGNGTWQAKNDYAIGTVSGVTQALALGDFNGDGKGDLLAATDETALTLLCGNGDGTFRANQSVAVGFNARSFGVGDFNGDGKLDVVVPSASTSTLAVLRGNGDGAFVNSTASLPAAAGHRFAVLDYNGDGKLDVALAGSAALMVMKGNGDGTFSALVESAQSNGQRSLSPIDLDGDGKLELLTPNGASNSLTVYRQNAAPTITANNQTPLQPGGLTRDGVMLATVGDCEDGATSLAVKINDAATATANGVTVSNLAIQADGKVMARVVTECQATTASFTLSVTDSTGMRRSASLTVQATPNTAPTLVYLNNAFTVLLGQSLTVTPTSGLSDDHGTPTVSVLRVQANAGGPFAGMATINTVGNATGVLSLSNVRPAGSYAAVIRAVDACGATTDATVYFIVQCPALLLNPINLPVGSSGRPYLQNFTMSGGAAPYQFALTNNSALPNGVALSASGVMSGTPMQTGVFSFQMTVTDANGCRLVNHLSWEVSNNQPPNVTPVAVQLYQSETNVSTVFGEVSDDRTPLGALVIRQVAGGTATGLTISNLRIDTSIAGSNRLIATVSTACNATSGTVCFDITDGEGLTTKLTAQANISGSGVSGLRYDNLTRPVILAGGATVNPTNGFTRSSLINSVVVQSLGPAGFTGSATVDSDGKVTISKAAPAGTYTATIRATDKCNVVRDASFMFQVIASPLLISEWRSSGPGGADDWYVELYNNTAQPMSTNGLILTGFNASGDGLEVALTANRMIPPRGCYLIGGAAYSLTSVPPDQSAPPVEGLGLISGWLVINDRLDYLDRAGTTDMLRNEADYAYEGVPVPTLDLTLREYAWVRKVPASTSGIPQDTNHNQNDFLLVATITTTIRGVAPQPGAPGPQNSASPLVNNAGLPVAILNPAVSANAAPNAQVESVPVTVGTATYPRSLYLRRTLTNNSNKPVTRLRFRITEISNGGVNTAILRALNASDIAINGQAVKGLTLETIPAQPTGGGLNSTLSAGSITLTSPLAAGAKVNVQFRLGIIQGGSYRFYANVEAQN